MRKIEIDKKFSEVLPEPEYLHLVICSNDADKPGDLTPSEVTLV